MNTCWSAALRCLELLEKHYNSRDQWIVALPSVWGIMFILQPIVLSWPHLIPKDKLEIYEWADRAYQQYLQHTLKSIEEAEFRELP